MSLSGNFITKLYYGIPGKCNKVVRLKLRFLSIILFFFFFIFYCVLARLTDVVWWVDGVLALQDTLQLLLTHMHPAILIPATQEECYSFPGYSPAPPHLLAPDCTHPCNRGERNFTAIQDTLQLLLTHMHPAVLIPVTQVRGMLELSMLSRLSPGVQA